MKNSLFVLFILSLFDDTFNCFDYIASNDRVIYEQLIVRDVEESGCGLI
jgi:hypothetical protein